MMLALQILLCVPILILALIFVGIAFAAVSEWLQRMIDLDDR